MNWRGRPLSSHEVVVELIGAPHCQPRRIDRPRRSGHRRLPPRDQGHRRTDGRRQQSLETPLVPRGVELHGPPRNHTIVTQLAGVISWHVLSVTRRGCCPTSPTGSATPARKASTPASKPSASPHADTATASPSRPRSTSTSVHYSSTRPRHDPRTSRKSLHKKP